VAGSVALWLVILASGGASGFVLLVLVAILAGLVIGRNA
jgi:hypothetical protein